MLSPLRHPVQGLSATRSAWLRLVSTGNQRNFAISLPNEHMNWTGHCGSLLCSALFGRPLFLPLPLSYIPLQNYMQITVPCCMHCPLAASETSESRQCEHCLYPASIMHALWGWVGLRSVTISNIISKGICQQHSHNLLEHYTANRVSLTQFGIEVFTQFIGYLIKVKELPGVEGISTPNSSRLNHFFPAHSLTLQINGRGGKLCQAASAAKATAIWTTAAAAATTMQKDNNSSNNSSYNGRQEMCKNLLNFQAVPLVVHCLHCSTFLLPFSPPLSLSRCSFVLVPF